MSAKYTITINVDMRQPPDPPYIKITLEGNQPTSVLLIVGILEKVKDNLLQSGAIPRVEDNGVTE